MVNGVLSVGISGEDSTLTHIPCKGGANVLIKPIIMVLKFEKCTLRILSP